MSAITSGLFWLLIVALIVALVWVLAARRSNTAGRRPRAKIVTDPVCHMRFPTDKAVAKARHAGATYYFCAEACLRDFQRDPARYAGAPEETTATP